MRAFIAVPLPPELRDKLGKISLYLRDNCPGVKWVSPENIHLTLKFLGEVKEDRLSRINKLLDEVVDKHGVIQAEVGGIGCFPNLRRPRVIWVGVKDQRKRLELLARDIEEKLAQLGFKREKRKFSGHLTLGRVKKRSSGLLDLEATFRRAGAESLGSLKIDMILLLKSTLTPRGAVYDTISEHKLAFRVNSSD